MHLQTHILASWCVGNGLASTPRQRLCCMLAGAVVDVDGLAYIAGQRAYQEYHHLLAHNVLFGTLLSLALATLSRHRRVRMFLLYLGLFYLHLVLDYFGSGPLWRLYVLWPFSRWALITPEDAWELFSWQNILAFGLSLAGTVWIAVRFRRTPLEAIMPSLDRQLVALLKRPVAEKVEI